MRIFLSSLVLFLSLFFLGCSHSVILPGSFQQRPEVGGRLLGGSASLGLQRTNEIEIFDDITTNPPTRFTTNGVGLVEVFLPIIPSSSLNLGLTSFMDLYYTSAVGARFQVLGLSGQPGWKSTIFAGGLVNSGSDTTNGTTTANTKITGTEYGFSIGYGFSKSDLIYITAGMQDGDAKTEIIQTAQTFNYDDNFEHSILTLGATLGENFFINTEISVTKTKWETLANGSETTDKTGGLVSLGFRW
jgi:hypothetical protein